MLKQIVVSLIVLAAAFAGWVFYFPGATETLARYGILIPFATVAETPPANQATPQGQNPGAQAPGGQNPAGQGQGNQRFGGRSQTPTVITEAVTSALINDHLTAIGEGSAIHSATVASSSGGQLMELEVSPGDVVKVGDVIGQLDADSERIAFDGAKLASDDANATLARTQELADANSATTAQLKAAQLAADNAALQLRNAELALQRRSITAPIAGTVGLIQVTPGNYVQAQTAVTTLDDSSEILVNFWVPERYASSIAVGMPLVASAVALPGKSFDGTVSAVDNRIDPTSRTLQIQARIPNETGQIRAGMSFSVEISFPGQTFPAVDPLAVQWSNEGAFVWKYADGKVTKGMITIIQRNSDGVLVDGAVAPGDEVVTQGVLQLSDGATVKLLDAPAEATASEGQQQPTTKSGDGQTPATPKS